MNMKEKIEDLHYWNWDNGNNDYFFEFFIDHGLRYSILITSYNFGLSFKNAIGNLYISKVIDSPQGNPVFIRDLLLANCKVSELLGQAYIDYKANYE